MINAVYLMYYIISSYYSLQTIDPVTIIRIIRIHDVKKPIKDKIYSNTTLYTYIYKYDTSRGLL